MKLASAALAAAAALVAVGGVAAQPIRVVRMGLSTEGMQIYQRTCVACHVSGDAAGGDPRAPRLETLRAFPPERILDALTSGKMQAQGAGLNDHERREVAEWMSARYLGAAANGDAKAMPNRCPASAPLAAKAPAWNGWSVDGRNARFQTAAAAGLTAKDLPRLKLKWAFGLPGGVQAFSQPTVWGGRLFLGSDSGQVYALDARTGCVRWSYLAEGGVRTAPVVVQAAGRPLVVVGDLKAKLYAIDARDGRLVWSVQIDEMPLSRITDAAVASGGRLFVGVSSGEEGAARLPGYACCRFRGAVAAVDAANGARVWKTYLVDEPASRPAGADGRPRFGPSGAGVWASPTVDAKRRRLYVATGDAYSAPAGPLTDAIVALDMDTGKVAWAHQDVADDVWVAGCAPGVTDGCPDKLGPDYDFASSAMLQDLPGGRSIVVAAHKGGAAVAVDPDRDGALVWRTELSKVPPRGGAADVLYGGAANGGRVYFGLEETDAIKALDLATGRVLWSAPVVTPPERAPRHGVGAAVTGVPGAVITGGWDGWLRAVSTQDGRLLWRFDTQREFDTVNRIAARGGSMGSAGATVAGGMMFVGSGYVGTNNGVPGNVLLAFGL